MSGETHESSVILVSFVTLSSVKSLLCQLKTIATAQSTA
jgi:hypothetical protein